MGNILLYINKADFERNKAEAEKRWNEELDSEGEGYMFEIEDCDVDSDVDGTTLNMYYNDTRSGIDVNISEQFNAKILTSISSLLSEKYDRVRSMFDKL